MIISINLMSYMWKQFMKFIINICIIEKQGNNLLYEIEEEASDWKSLLL